MSERQKSVDQLWSLLPLVYRERDRSKGGGDHLRLYLEACGDLLDRVRETLEQSHADAFARIDDGAKTRQLQEWLLPYFARLLDARLLSPYVEGRRAEIADAIGWRQRKGTRRCVEEIAETVGQFEVEMQEGWQHVAVTPRIDKPVLRDLDLEKDGKLDEDGDLIDPLDGPQHRHLPVATVDVRYTDRAVPAEPGDAFARQSRFDGEVVPWRSRHPHGVPCFPGTYEDASVRTVDVRTPDWNVGHFHPRNLLLFVPPPCGFFRPDPVQVAWADIKETAEGDHTFYALDEDGRRTLYSKGAYDFAGADAVPSATASPYTVIVTEESVEIGEAVFDDEASPPPDVIAGLCFDGCLTLRGRTLRLRSVAARKIKPVAVGARSADLDARGCLFDELEGGMASIQLEYCTVLESTLVKALNASDCIFDGVAGLDEPESSCLRYSRIPRALAEQISAPAGTSTNTSDAPVFHAYRVCPESIYADSVSLGAFGTPGCGVLHPRTPETVRFGAEDGGEMGAYHERFHSLAAEAIVDKLTDYLPLGIVPVVIPDARLHVAPQDDHD